MTDAATTTVNAVRVRLATPTEPPELQDIASLLTDLHDTLQLLRLRIETPDGPQRLPPDIRVASLHTGSIEVIIVAGIAATPPTIHAVNTLLTTVWTRTEAKRKLAAEATAAEQTARRLTVEADEAETEWSRRKRLLGQEPWNDADMYVTGKHVTAQTCEADLDYLDQVAIQELAHDLERSQSRRVAKRNQFMRAVRSLLNGKAVPVRQHIDLVEHYLEDSRTKRETVGRIATAVTDVEPLP